tara:strand:- start:38543 stop:39217 length:675 start_codon:yes stop_codon:yes gene_type:complete
MDSDYEKNKSVWKKIYSKGQKNKYPWDRVVSFIYNLKIKDIDRKQIKILEVGCGTGSNLWFASREGFNVTGIDFSSEAIFQAKKLLDQDGLKYNLIVCDFIDLPFEDESFDVVIDRASLTCVNFSLAKKSVNEIRRVLKNKGKFLFTPYSTKHSSYQRNESNKNYFMKKIINGNLKENGNICFYNKKIINNILKDWNILSIKHLLQEDYSEKSIHAEWEVIAEK